MDWDISAYTNKELRKLYREKLKAKMAAGELFEEDTCAACKGGVTKLTFKNLIPVQAVEVVVYDDPSPKPDRILFQGTLKPDDVFTIVPRPGQNDFHNDICIYVNGAFNTEIHTSCSEPIGPGAVYGDFLITDGRSKDNGLMCPLNVCDPAAAPALVFHDREIRWDVTNTGDLGLEIESITISWPEAAGDLEEIKRDGDKFHEGDFTPAQTLIDSGWESDPNKRTIKPGETDTLKFKFKNDVETIAGTYAIEVAFTYGCSISIEEIQ
jgi:hypothetical protein